MPVTLVSFCSSMSHVCSCLGAFPLVLECSPLRSSHGWLLPIVQVPTLESFLRGAFSDSIAKVGPTPPYPISITISCFILPVTLKLLIYSFICLLSLFFPLECKLHETFSLSFFTLIKRLFSSSSLSAIRLVSSAYLRLAKSNSRGVTGKLPLRMPGFSWLLPSCCLGDKRFSLPTT